MAEMAMNEGVAELGRNNNNEHESSPNYLLMNTAPAKSPSKSPSTTTNTTKTPIKTTPIKSPRRPTTRGGGGGESKGGAGEGMRNDVTITATAAVLLAEELRAERAAAAVGLHSLPGVSLVTTLHGPYCLSSMNVF
jgi:hypothetical protein